MKKVIKLVAPVKVNKTALPVESFNGVESGWYVKYRDEVREVSEVYVNSLSRISYVVLKEGFPFILESGIELEVFPTKYPLYVKYQGSLHSVKEVYVKYQGSLYRVKAIYKKEGGELKGREL